MLCATLGNNRFHSKQGARTVDYTYDIRRDTEPRPPTAQTDEPIRYWVRESKVRVRSGPGLQHPVLTHLARGAEVVAAMETPLPADGHHWQPIRWGTDTAYVARELLATAHVRPDPVGSVPVAPALVRAVQGTPLATHTRSLMAMALCESGARTARDNGGELVYRFEPRQWDRLFRPTLGEPPATWTAEKCYVTSWGVGQVMGWSHATFGCADARVFRDWLQADPAHEYAALVRFCLAKPGVTEALQTRDWEQLWQLYNGGHPQWLPNFKAALARVMDAEPVSEVATPPPDLRVSPAAVATEPVAVPPVASPEREVPQRTIHRLRPAAMVRPTLQGLRYEGGRLLRRAFLLVTLGFTLWRTDIITPDQVGDLLAEAVVPLVTTQTAPVAVRLDHGLAALEARLAVLEQAGQNAPDGTGNSPINYRTPAASAVSKEDAASFVPGPEPYVASAPRSPDASCWSRQTVTDSWYHVRVQPDLDAEVVAVLGPGTPVCILVRQDDWHLVQDPVGWIVEAGLQPLPVAG